jgi:hypothetical protein
MTISLYSDRGTFLRYEEIEVVRPKKKSDPKIDRIAQEAERKQRYSKGRHFK